MNLLVGAFWGGGARRGLIRFNRGTRQMLGSFVHCHISATASKTLLCNFVVFLVVGGSVCTLVLQLSQNAYHSGRKLYGRPAHKDADMTMVTA